MACNCPSDNVTNFCGKGIVKNSMCFLPSINPADATITITQPNLADREVRVEFVDCGLIIICGVYNKSVSTPAIAFTERIPFQFSIQDPAIEDLDPARYSVTAVEVREVCSDFTCLNTNGNSYKLNEKDIISVIVRYIV